jgi:hypothetical protein
MPEENKPIWFTFARIEVIFLVLLLLTTFCSTFCAYQANSWNSLQSAKNREGTDLRTQSVRAYNDGNTRALVDLNVFLAWVDAVDRNDTMKADALVARFTPEFKPAFDAWTGLVKGQPAGTIPPGTPFSLPEYHLSARERGVLLEENATKAYNEGEYAGTVGTRYILNTLLYALVLVLCGVGERWKTPVFQKVILLAAILLFSYATAMLLWLPKSF